MPEDKFKCLPQGFSKRQLEFVKQKGHYLYEYTNSFESFGETILPCNEELFNMLNDKHIRDKNYGNVLTIWNEFEMKNMEEYHDLYLKTGVSLLAYVFEEFSV